MNKNLLVGCGSLGKIILDGLISPKNEITVLEKNTDVRKKIKIKNVKVIKDIDNKTFEEIEYILLCIKPKDSKRFLESFRIQKQIKYSYLSWLG